MGIADLCITGESSAVLIVAIVAKRNATAIYTAIVAVTVTVSIKRCVYTRPYFFTARVSGASNAVVAVNREACVTGPAEARLNPVAKCAVVTIVVRIAWDGKSN
jgi:hypothetical protein